MVGSIFLLILSCSLVAAQTFITVFKGDTQKAARVPDVTPMLSRCFSAQTSAPSADRMDSIMMLDDKNNEPKAFVAFERVEYTGKKSNKKYNAVEIYSFCIDPKFQGQGESYRFLRQAIQLFQSNYDLPSDTILGIQTGAAYGTYLQAFRTLLKLGFTKHFEIAAQLDNVDPDILHSTNFEDRTSFDKFMTVYNQQVTDAIGTGDFDVSMFRFIDDGKNMEIRRMQRCMLKACGYEFKENDDLVVNPIPNPMDGENDDSSVAVFSISLPGDRTSTESPTNSVTNSDPVVKPNEKHNDNRGTLIKASTWILFILLFLFK